MHSLKAMLIFKSREEIAIKVVVNKHKDLESLNRKEAF